MRLDQTWHGTCTQFLNRWKSKMLDIEGFSGTIDSDATKRADLVTSVQPHAGMQRVEVLAIDIEVTHAEL